MGLDNFWLVPKQDEENMSKFQVASSNASVFEHDPDDVEFDTAHYHGDEDLNIVGGIFSANGNGSFRGKFYSPLCDAMLQEDSWLYSFHFTSEIEEAFSEMIPIYIKLRSPDAQKHWEEIISYGRDNVTDSHAFFDSYTIEDALNFIKMFEYYVTVENICLSAWF